MEGAARVFAGEYTRARLPLYPVPGRGDRVLTPSGACCHLIFLSGTLTETEQRGPDRWYGRVADPTGVYEIHAHRPDAVNREAVRQIEPPAFVTIMGEAHFFPGSKDSGPSISLIQIQVSDRPTRDRWVLRTAEISSARLEALSELILSGPGTTGCAAAAIRQYNVTGKVIRELAAMVGHALTTIGPIGEPVQERDGIREKILTIIRESAGPKGIPLSDLLTRAGRYGLGEREVREAVRSLLDEDECYQPARDVFRPL